MYFFTSDEHYFHKNIMKHSNRPFSSVEEMNSELIKRHNKVVGKNDIVIHGGDLTFIKPKERVYREIVNKLNGNHIFVQGNHDHWIPKKERKHIWEKYFKEYGLHIVVCHYPMRTWNKSHYGSIQLFGHVHGNLEPYPNQYDIGVDVNNFYPVSLEYIAEMFGGDKFV